MIGLEYILKLYDVQHQELAERLGIKKQNINLWIKGKQNISKKYIPVLTEMFKVDEIYFQKEIDELDKYVIQMQKLDRDMNLTIEKEVEGGYIYIPSELIKMNATELEFEKSKLIQGFSGLLADIKSDDEVDFFQRLLKLFRKHDVPILYFMIDAVSHYFNVLPDWVENEMDVFDSEFIELATKHFGNYLDRYPESNE